MMGFAKEGYKYPENYQGERSCISPEEFEDFRKLQNENAELEKALKKKPKTRRKNDFSMDEGDSARIAGFLAEIKSWDVVDKGDIKALQDRFDQYVKFCIDNDMKVTNINAYFALGISKSTAMSWARGGRSPQHLEFITEVNMFCAAFREQLGSEGKINPVTLVWWQKNFDDMRDRQEVVVIPTNPLGADADLATIQKYQSALPSANMSSLPPKAEIIDAEITPVEE